MGEFSHIPTAFDNVVSVVLENDGVSISDALTPEKPISRRRHGKDDSPTPDGMIRISSWKNVVNEKEKFSCLSNSLVTVLNSYSYNIVLWTFT